MVFICEEYVNCSGILNKRQKQNFLSVFDITHFENEFKSGIWPPGLVYTGCLRRNVPDFGRVFLMLKYTDITQNTNIQSWTVTEIMAREKWGFLRFQILQPAQLIRHVTMLAALRGECSVHCACVTLCAVSHVKSPRGILTYSAWNPKDNYEMSASVFVVQFNGFMSLTS